MFYEAIFMLAASILGLVQNVLASRYAKFDQIQRNFGETYFIVIICFLITTILDGAGPAATKAAGIYLIGRLLYVALTLMDRTGYRKGAWALSMVGVIGWILIVIRATIQQFL